MRLEHDRTWLRRVTAAQEFGRVAVLFGGDSSEREISLLSGNAVLAALQRRGVDAHAFDPRERALPTLLEERCERVWIALHGPGGEDGTLQGRSSIWACRTQGAASWDPPSAWISCARSVSRCPSASQPRITWCCAGHRISISRSSAWVCR